MRYILAGGLATMGMRLQISSPDYVACIQVTDQLQRRALLRR